VSADRVAIIATGVANTASVAAAFRRAGAEPIITDDPGVVRAAPRAVLPGVGAFGAGMARLRATGLDAEIIRRIDRSRPLLAVCLGLQLLCAESEETPGVQGLGVIDARVERFGPGLRVPQFGWNLVKPGPGAALVREGYAYFANSYRIAEPPRGWACATSTHGGPFVATLERGPILACQFHPELSGAWGLDLIGRWLARTQEAVAC